MGGSVRLCEGFCFATDMALGRRQASEAVCFMGGTISKYSLTHLGYQFRWIFASQRRKGGRILFYEWHRVLAGKGFSFRHVWRWVWSLVVMIFER